MLTNKILVVDDEENVCQSVKKILGRKGYEVSQALTVDDAVKLINDLSFDLVITDLMIPGTSGMELMHIIREKYPELDVIMITGYASIESAVSATKLGASAYLPKPFTPDELTKATEHALANRVIRVKAKSTPKRMNFPMRTSTSTCHSTLEKWQSRRQSNSSRHSPTLMSRSIEGLPKKRTVIQAPVSAGD
jgi:DNA-binding NtrC family response regulator